MKLYKCAILSSVLLTTGASATMINGLYDSSVRDFDYSQKKKEPVKKKVTNEDVILQVQSQLKDKGYSIGVVDGIYGPRTRDIIKKFQKDFGLYPTGTISAETLGALGLQYTSGKLEEEDYYSE